MIRSKYSQDIIILWLLWQDIKAADWSENVAPFWPAVIKSALTWKGFTSILRSGELCCAKIDVLLQHFGTPFSVLTHYITSSGWKTIKAALAMPLMIEGYKKGLIKFVIITCRKPE